MPGFSIHAANDNDLGRDVFVHMPEPANMHLAVLTDIFGSILDAEPIAANDNGMAKTQQEF